MASAAVTPLLDSKLHAPRRRRGVVPRLRLERRLALDALPAVTLVSAPAGFGKTTVVTEWLADAPRVAWLSLDRRDSDPALYWSYVLAALGKALPEVGRDASATLLGAPQALDAVVASLLNDLAALREDVVLVLDDYHLVESLDVQESMLFLVEHLPPQLHLVVASRADPPWPLAGLRAAGDLLEIRANDLRFTTDEAAAYLEQATGLELAPSDVAALEGRTEGWIAALQLAALSLRGRADPAAFIEGFAGDDRFVVDYLVDEVLDRQPPDIRSFLLETSILNRFTAPLCAAVTGRDDAKAALDAVDRANLFLVPLDDRRRWYRYHHLFGDVLRARLADDRPERLHDLHRRASAWFEAEGERPEAIRHAVAAEDFDKAAELVELGIPALRQTRQDATQQEWIDALPARVFANRPVLSLARVGAQMVRGDVDGVGRLLDDIEACLEPDGPKSDVVVHDQAELRRVPAQIAMYRAGICLLAGDLAGAVAHGERAGALSAADDFLGRGAAAALVGLADWARGDLAAAADQYAEAIAQFHDAGYHADILGCSLGLADVQTGLGQLSAAERTLAAGLALDEAHGPLRGVADMHIGLAEIHLERNELDLVADHLSRSLDLGEHLALAQHAHRWRVVDARLRAIGGDHAGAIALLDAAERLYDTDYSPKVRPVAAVAARVRLAAGDVTGPERWAAAAGVAAEDEVSYLREYEHLTLARLLIATGRGTEAISLLDRVLAAAEAGGRARSAVEAHLLLALAHQLGGDTSEALASLTDALTRAHSERYVRVFLDAGAPARRLLETALRHDPAADLARAVLAAGEAPAAAVSGQGLVDELSGRELEVLRLLRTELSGPEIAAELIVSINTVRTHTKNIFAKLGVTNRRSAVRRADELGL